MTTTSIEPSKSSNGDRTVKKTYNLLPPPPSRIRHYVVAYQCPRCEHRAWLEDFTGSREITCQCGQSISVEVD